MVVNSRNLPRYIVGRGAVDQLPELLAFGREDDGCIALLVGTFFKDLDVVGRRGATNTELVLYLDVGNEPTTDCVNEITRDARQSAPHPPAAVVGVGGGTSLDIAKAISNLLGNGGRAEDYQC